MNRIHRWISKIKRPALAILTLGGMLAVGVALGNGSYLRYWRYWLPSNKEVFIPISNEPEAFTPPHQKSNNAGHDHNTPLPWRQLPATHAQIAIQQGRVQNQAIMEPLHAPVAISPGPQSHNGNIEPIPVISLNPLSSGSVSITSPYSENNRLRSALEGEAGLAHRYQSTNDESLKLHIKERLKSQLEAEFEQSTSLAQTKVTELESQLAEAKANIDKRVAKRDAIIAARQNALVGNREELAWEFSIDAEIKNALSRETSFAPSPPASIQVSLPPANNDWVDSFKTVIPDSPDSGLEANSDYADLPKEDADGSAMNILPESKPAILDAKSTASEINSTNNDELPDDEIAQLKERLNDIDEASLDLDELRLLKTDTSELLTELESVSQATLQDAELAETEKEILDKLQHIQGVASQYIYRAKTIQKQILKNRLSSQLNPDHFDSKKNVLQGSAISELSSIAISIKTRALVQQMNILGDTISSDQKAVK